MVPTAARNKLVVVVGVETKYLVVMYYKSQELWSSSEIIKILRGEEIFGFGSRFNYYLCSSELHSAVW